MEIVKYINKLGYIDILLILLNLNVNKVLEIKKNMNVESKMYGGINIENIVNKTVEKIMEQIMDTKNSNLDTTTEESILDESSENIIEHIKNKFIGGKMEEEAEAEAEAEAEVEVEAEAEADIDDGNIYSKFIKEKEYEENTLYTVEVKKEGITEERRLTKKR